MSNETIYSGISDTSLRNKAGIIDALNETDAVRQLFDWTNRPNPAGGTWGDFVRGVGAGNIILPFAMAPGSASVATDGTVLSTNVQFTTSHPTITIRELAIVFTLTDGDAEDTGVGMTGELNQAVIRSSVQSLVNGHSSDITTLFASFSTSHASHAGSDYTTAMMREAMAKLRKQNAHGGMGGLVQILSVDQWFNLAADISTQGFEIWGGNVAADIQERLGVAKEGAMPEGAPYGVGTWASNHCQDTGTGSDETGYLGTKNAIFFAYKRAPRPEFQREARMRGNDLVFSERYAYGEARDEEGCRISAR